MGAKGTWTHATVTEYDDVCRSGGGGGASMVAVTYPGARDPILQPLIVAGGGGGATSITPGGDARLGLDGGTVRDAMVGGAGGVGGVGGDAHFAGGGGGIVRGGGKDSEGYGEAGGASLAAESSRALPIEGTHGGYGGGGGVSTRALGGGGGGGYSGGSGGTWGGGGGGSYAHTSVRIPHCLEKQMFIGNEGDGIVRIEKLSGASITELTDGERVRLADICGPQWRNEFPNSNASGS